MLGLSYASAGLAGRSGNSQDASHRVAVQLLFFFSWVLFVAEVSRGCLPTPGCVVLC